MAIRIDASGDYLRRTANLPTTSAFTACCWFYYVATRSAYCYFLGVDDASAEYILLGFDNTNGFGISYSTSPFGNNFSSNPATSAWHFAAIRANGTNVKGFHRTLAGTWQTVTSSVTPSFTPTGMYFGSDSWDEWVNCRLAGIKVWDAALTDAEIENEAETLLPQRFANLNLWTPGFPGSGERTRDYSGNGRNLTEGGTLTDEDPPPVAWGGRTLFFPFAAGGSTQFATFSATGTGSAAFIKVPTKLFAPVTGTGTPTFSKAPAKIVPTVTANGAASFVKVPTKIIATLIAAGTATFTTVKTKVVTFALVTATGAASFIKAPLKIIALTGTGGASFVKVPTRIISPLTATGSASFLKTPTKIIALSATGAATFTTLKVKLVSFVVTATGSVSFLKTPTKIIALSASGAASFTKVPTKVISPLTASGAATFTTLKVRLVTFALVTATGTASFLKTPQKVFTLTATGAPTFVKNVSKIIAVAANGTSAFVKSAAKTIPTLTATGSATFIKSALKMFSAAASGAATFTTQTIPAAAGVALRHFTLKARSRVLTLAARSVGFLLRTRGRAFTLETWAGEEMTSRAFMEGRQLQGVDETVVYTLTTTNWGSSPASVSVKVFDVTADFADVTSTVMPTGSPSVSGDVITLPALKLLTETHLYRVEVKFTCSGNIFEAYGEILAER